MANLTRNSKRREQRLQEILLDRLTAKYERRLQREISKAMKKAAKAYSPDNTTAIDVVVMEHKERLNSILTKLWIDTGKTFSEHIAGAAKASGKMIQKNAFVIPPTEQATSIMMDWIRTIGLTKITQISTTTKNDIEKIINQGLKDGQSEHEIASYLTTVAPSISYTRGRTIARTETHGAANVSAQATAEATGVEMKREWVSAKSERTRTSHAAADGQVVGMHDPFKVGDASLMFPGDYNAGSPSETINCRCAVVFVL